MKSSIVYEPRQQKLEVAACIMSSQVAETKEGLLVLNSLLPLYTVQDLLLIMAPPIIWMSLPILIKIIKIIPLLDHFSGDY